MLKEENSNIKFISNYNCNEVCEFVKSIGLEELINKIEELNIEGYDLCLDNNDLFSSLEISNPHNLIKLKKNIKLKLLEELQINFSFKGNLYPIQLDYNLDLTIENIIENISNAFDFKEKFSLSTIDNELLSQKIKFIDLLLLNPEKYKIIKIFNPKENEIPSPISGKSDIKKDLDNIPYLTSSNSNSIPNEENQFFKNQIIKDNIINIQEKNNFSNPVKNKNNIFSPINTYQINAKRKVNNNKNIKDSYSSPQININKYTNKSNQKGFDILGDLNNNLKIMKENLLKNNIEIDFRDPLLNIPLKEQNILSNVNYEENQMLLNTKLNSENNKNKTQNYFNYLNNKNNLNDGSSFSRQDIILQKYNTDNQHLKYAHSPLEELNDNFKNIHFANIKNEKVVDPHQNMSMKILENKTGQKKDN